MQLPRSWNALPLNLMLLPLITVCFVSHLMKRISAAARPSNTRKAPTAIRANCSIFTLDSTLGKLALVGAPIAVGVVVYVICVIKLKAITREDCLLLPKGEKIAKLLHL